MGSGRLHLSEWLTEKVYRDQIQPKLATFTVTAIASALGISKPYATDIRAGKRVPHRRHWEKLARLAIRDHEKSSSISKSESRS
jgi:hypothetical protein